MNNKNIKSKTKIGFITLFVLFISGCTDYLELTPLDKVSSDQLLTSEKGVLTLLANLYNAIPMEDFNFRDNNDDGAFYNRGIGNGNIGMTSMYSDEAIRSDGNEAMGHQSNYDYFSYAYQRNRDVSLFIESIEKAKNDQVINEATFERLESEAYFVRAYLYFGLVRRYGGVPIIDETLDKYYVPGSDNEAIIFSRSTEKETFDFILENCDKAAANLPLTLTANDKFRADKWTALALKSRVALYAASLAKYWNNANLTGEAVNRGYVGIAADEANRYYLECINASKDIIDNSGRSLYMPDPNSPEEAATNYQNLFLTSNNEIIFSRTYLDGSVVSDQGHSYDAFYSPSQAHPGYLRHGRYSVTLDIVDLYEDYSDDGTGNSALIATRDNGNENYSYGNPANINVNDGFKKYDDLSDPFIGKDARLQASVIVPGAMYKNTKIIMQGGLIRKNGELVVYGAGSEEGFDGQTYYTYGGASPAEYSGFDNLGRGFENSNFSCSGFSVRKYLSEFQNLIVGGGTAVSTTPWIDFRLAEVYLNYAEAVVESGQGDATVAASYLNQLRKRAAHKDEIPLTLSNVLKERRVEMAFEGRRFDDMIRRREYHSYFNVGRRKALVPIIDLREATPKYIFVRANLYYDEQLNGRTFNPVDYYMEIPGTSTSGLVQNPGH